MKIIKFCIVAIFIISQFSSSFAIKQPQIISPTSKKTSLRPIFEWGTVKNASSYSVKIKELDDSTGAYSTVESDTTVSTNYRVTTTLTAGKYYKGIFKSIQSDNTKSDKETIYFQAEDKCIYINQSQLQLDNDAADYDPHGFLAPQAYIDFTLVAQANANFHLPNGSIITGFEVAFVDNAAGGPLFFLHRLSLADGSAELIGSVSSSDTADSASVRIGSSSNLNSDTTEIDNSTYQYQFFWITVANAQFHYVKISYI